MTLPMSDSPRLYISMLLILFFFTGLKVKLIVFFLSHKCVGNYASSVHFYAVAKIFTSFTSLAILLICTRTNIFYCFTYLCFIAILRRLDSSAAIQELFSFLGIGTKQTCYSLAKNLCYTEVL